MGRKKVARKNKSISISLTKEQIDFIENHPKFNLSKFVQIHLQDYIYLAQDVEEYQLKMGVEIGKETIR